MKKIILIYILIFSLKIIPTTNEIIETKEYINKTDIVGNLSIPNILDIPLVQTNNNEYYLNHNINKEIDIKGTEFIDYRNKPNDKQINIYGHNSTKHKVPFKELEKLLNKNIFNEDIYIYLNFNNIKRKYILASIIKTNNNIHMNINRKNTKEHINNILKNSIYKKDINYNNNTNIIVIQTCALIKNNYYLIIGFEIN